MKRNLNVYNIDRYYILHLQFKSEIHHIKINKYCKIIDNFLMPIKIDDSFLIFGLIDKSY
jgi:hypothetical protein